MQSLAVKKAAIGKAPAPSAATPGEDQRSLDQLLTFIQDGTSAGCVFGATTTSQYRVHSLRSSRLRKFAGESNSSCRGAHLTGLLLSNCSNDVCIPTHDLQGQSQRQSKAQEGAQKGGRRC